MNCPWCNQKIFIVQDKGIVLDIDIQQECPKCKKIFLYKYSVIVTKPGCLNNEKRHKHIWEPSFNSITYSYDSKICMNCGTSKKNTPKQKKFLNAKNRKFIKFMKEIIEKKEGRK